MDSERIVVIDSERIVFLEDSVTMNGEAAFWYKRSQVWLKRTKFWRRTAFLAIAGAFCIFIVCALLLLVVGHLVGRFP